MGRLGKETKIMLMGITVVCLLSFVLAVGIAVLLANNFQQEMLIHDSGIAGYLLNHGDELEVAALRRLHGLLPQLVLPPVGGVVQVVAEAGGGVDADDLSAELVGGVVAVAGALRRSHGR